MNAKRIHPTSYHQHNGVFRAETAVMKVSFVTKARYLGCGVGYYEQVGLQNDAGVLWLKAR
jgi:hypothetical protein